MKGHPQIEYWQRFIKGDKEAFKMLYDIYVDELYTYGARYCTDPEIVKDSIHDLFFDLYRYRPNLNPSVNVKAYLFGSFRRKVLAGKKRFFDAFSHDDQTSFTLAFETEDYIVMADEEENEILARLQLEMKKLPPRQKEALYLRFTCELSYDQVSEIMDISMASCRTLIYRAIKDLRERMEKDKISLLLFMTFLSPPSKGY